MNDIQTITSKNQTAAQLVRDAQAGDREAMGELFERFEQYVFSIAMRRMGDWNEAQELTQEVFVQAMMKLDQLRVPEAFGGWLRRITNRMAINRLTRKRPAFTWDPDRLAEVYVDDETPQQAALHRERDEQLHEGLKRLRELDRQTLTAFYFEGQSLIEMSDQFEAPIGTIKRRLHTARKRLAAEVEA